MMKSVFVSALMMGSASAFMAVPTKTTQTQLNSFSFPRPPATGFEETGGEMWDPLSLYNLDDNIGDVFPNMFPKPQYLEEAELKHGRMSMLAWTGVWATSVGKFGLGLHIPGMPVETDWTKALGVFASEQPGIFGAVLLFIAIAEGESVGHSGDNFRGMSTKTTPGDLNYDPLGLKSKLSPEKLERYRVIELKNGRAAMIAMASLFSMQAIPGSVPIMDILK
mmetsp:Transcript_33478/g.51317  ORF Transcript_33478/g.51317 Transcript_33478/m.51317 type:complete len:222 (+) Transcript_33478:60-725(+)